MDRVEVFQILGIEDTKDESAIKNAYRKKLTVTNPEDDPEGFKRLRTAYEEACRLAKEEEKEIQKDTTPSGLWVERAAEIYGNIRTRQDSALWRELFADDCFLSLEEEENCRMKLLSFLMVHFRLPTHIWKLLDKKLGITSDKAALREHFPADFIRYIVGKCERGEDVEFDQFEGAEDAPYDLFFQHYDHCIQAFQEDDADRAKECIQNADQLGIYHPVMEICRAELFMRLDRRDEALKLMFSLREKYPEDALIGYNTAENLWRQGADGKEGFRAQAAEIYQKLKEENDQHYMANLRLTEWYCDQGQFYEAKKCAEKVLTAGGDPSFMELLAKVNSHIEKDLEEKYRATGDWEPAMELCWCYLQDGRANRGLQLAVRLEKYLSRFPLEKEAEYHGLSAKLYVEQARYEESIDTTRFWEEALKKKLAAGEDEEEAKKDKDRLKQAHLIRMQCYHSLGFRDSKWFAEAIKEGEATLENSIKDVGVLLEMAQIFVEMQEYDRCLELVDRLVREYQIFAAYAVSLEAYRRQLNAGGVVSAAGRCIQYFPAFVKPYEYIAKVYLDLKRPEDFRKVLEDAQKNGVRSVLLDAYRYQAEKNLPEGDSWALDKNIKKFREEFLRPLEKGHMPFYQSGLPKLTEYLYRFPDSYMLVERGVFHKAAHHYEEARDDFEKALSISPANPYALNGLSQVYKYLGDYEKALVCIRKAILYMDKHMSPVIYADMSDIYCLLGDYSAAEAAYFLYEQAVAEKTVDIWFVERQAECYVNLGNIQKACQLYQGYQSNAPYKSYRKQAFGYARGQMREQAVSALIQWKAALDGAYGPAFKRKMTVLLEQFDEQFNRNSIISINAAYCRYHNMAGWVELMTGDTQAVRAQFGKSLKYVYGAKGDGMSPIGMLSDAVFAYAVCGEQKLGVKWAKLLKKWMIQEKYNVQTFYESEKQLLMYELQTAYFLGNDQEIKGLLDREQNLRICRYCTSPACREVEGMRILFLMKTGHREEAKERLKRNLEIQPADEYMLSIRHQVFGDQS